MWSAIFQIFLVFLTDYKNISFEYFKAYSIYTVISCTVAKYRDFSKTVSSDINLDNTNNHYMPEFKTFPKTGSTKLRKLSVKARLVFE